METIVVGFDGSPGSEAALRWALHEAMAREQQVLVVQAWAPTTSYAVGVAGAAWPARPYPQQLAALRVGVADALDTQVARIALEEGVHPPLQSEVVEGLAAATLVAASYHAALLVVGSRGHGAIASAVLGSVSHHCAQHAGCPVVVVRTSTRIATDADVVAAAAATLS
jgi:nucleotide-binding universal stress UspA family protein